MHRARMRNQSRIAVMGGVRTPFAKRRTAYREMSALDLGTACVSELLHRSELEPEAVDLVVFGRVAPGGPHNIAREVALDADLPAEVEAFSVSEACITGYRAVITAVQAIRSGLADCVIAGGADSASAVPLTISPELKQVLERERAATGWIERVGALTGLSPRHLLPEAPGLVERATGLSMGESAERMAKQNGISRADQDAYAHASHRKAARAWAESRFSEVMTVHVNPRYERHLAHDNLVRADSDLDAYRRLDPVFDERHGTITAGTSSPLSDGASALLLGTEEKARELDIEPIGYIEAYAFAAVDPRDQLLIGPALALPRALADAGLSLEDLDLLDLHEAFAAQVLSVVRRLEADGVGSVDMDRLNVSGGSIAIGHPFAATGGRQIMQTLNDLRRRQEEFGACSACAAGGLAAALVLRAAARAAA